MENADDRILFIKVKYDVYKLLRLLWKKIAETQNYILLRFDTNKYRKSPPLPADEFG